MSAPAFARASRILALATAALGAVGVIAQLAGAAWLQSYVPGRPAMMLNTALALLVAGATAAACARTPVAPRARRIARLAGALLLVVGAATLLQYVLGRSFGIDLVAPARAPVGPYPGRPSPLTAIAIAAVGAALVWLDARPAARVPPREWLAAVVLSVAVVSIVGHMHRAGRLYELGQGSAVTGVALPTGVALLCLGAALLLARPGEGLMRLVTASTPAGRSLRWLGLAAVVGPLLVGAGVGWLLSRGVEHALVLGLLTASTIIVGVALLLVNAVPLERAGEAVEAGRARLQALLDLAPDGVFVVGPDARYRDVNPAGCRMLGRTRDEIVGHAVTELVPLDEQPRLLSERAQLVAGGHMVSEWRLRHKDGHYVPVEISASMLADGSRHAFIRDITARRAAEAERWRWQRRLDGVIDAAADAIITLDGEGRMLLYNRGAESIFGWSRAEMLGRPLEALLPGAPRVADGARAIVGGRRKDGAELTVDAAVSRLDLEGEALTIVVLRDISERERMERELRETRAFLENVLASATEVAIVAADRDGRIILWNDGARRVYGHEAGEAVGLPLEALHEDAAATRALHEAALAGRHAEALLVGRRKDGTSRVLRATLTPRGAAGTLLVAADVTSEQQTLDRLAASLRENQVLLREVHHRVKNNLQVVSSLLNLQALRVADAEVRRLFEESRARVSAIAFVHDRLYRARDLAHIDVDEYLSSLVAHLGTAADARGRGITLDVEPGGVRLPVDQAIPSGMIVTELVSNALAHAFPGGRGGAVRVTLRRDGAALLLLVEDDGVGLPDGLDPRDTPSLGLELVYSFAAQLHAEVEVRRRPGAGFTLRFPAPPAA